MIDQQTAVAEIMQRLSPANRVAAIKAAGFASGEKSSSYDTFKETYWSDPAGFVLDCIKWDEVKKGAGLTAYQKEILGQIPVKRRVAVRGPHGLGKTAMAAWVVLWFALTRDGKDWKIPTTAGAWRQLTKFLWPEIKKWARYIDWQKVGREPFNRHELLKLNLNLETGESFAVASNDPQLIEGAHADHILYVFDESKAIIDETFDAVEGAFSTGEAYAFAISTPGETNGRFYDIHRRKAGLDDWWVRHVTLAETTKAGRVDRQWAEQRKKQWGESSSVYQNRVLGEFAASDEDSVIPLAHIELANERWYVLNESSNWGSFVCVGVDVARMGSDTTELALRYGDAVKEIRTSRKEDTMETAGRVTGVLRGHGGYAVIDLIGIGAGVFDNVREKKLDARPFNASERTDKKDVSGELGFTNKRSAAWWNMRELLDPANGHDVALPPDDELIGDLTSPKWRVMSGGKIQVESKADIVKRIKRSTNKGDGVIQAFWVEAKSPPPAMATVNIPASVYDPV